MTLAIFGGSFNPVHAAHQLVALYVLETCAVDELWLVPTYAHPFGKPLAPYDHRIELATLAAKPLGPRVLVSRAEEALAHAPGFVASRTLDLVEHVRAARPGEPLRLVIGADILHETSNWHRWADLVALAPPIVIGRTGSAPPAGVAITSLAMPEISATRARALLAALTAAERGELAAPPGSWREDLAPQLRALLPRAVLCYIARNGLYT